MTTSTTSARMNDISLMRVFCIFSVVAFHVYQMTWCMPGQEGRFGSEIGNICYNLYYVPIYNVLINIGMPLFTVISGYLFFWQISIGKLTSWRQVLVKKAKRILIPYIAFSIPFMATTGVFFKTHIWIAFINGSYWHLWFLPTIMLSFIIGYATRKWMGNIATCFLIIAIFATLRFTHHLWLPEDFPITKVTSLTKWYVWFAVGGGILHLKAYFKPLQSLCIDYLFLIGGGAYISLLPLEYGNNDPLNNIAIALALLGIFSILNRFNFDWVGKSKALALIDRCSMGTYIFHFWVAVFLVSSTARNLFSLDHLLLTHPIIFPFCFFLSTFAVSMFLTWLLQQTRAGRYILGQ